MATNTVPSDDTGVGTFPTALPVDIPHRNRLSWELGTHIVDGETAERLFDWHAETGWKLTAFRIASHTLVVRFRTPVGRELFYVAEISARSVVRRRLELAAGWHRTE